MQACLLACLPACLPACLLACLLVYLLACMCAFLLVCMPACLVRGAPDGMPDNRNEMVLATTNGECCRDKSQGLIRDGKWAV